MADIDFEELDKAVNSLMNQRNGEQEADPNRAESLNVPPERLATPTARPASPQVELPQPASAASSMQPEASASGQATPPLIARRQGGRFMDVVHPSSDMRNASGHKPVEPQPARRSAKLEPINPAQFENSEQDFMPERPMERNETVPRSDISDDADFGNLPETVQVAPMESPFLTNVEIDKRPLGAAEQPVAESSSQTEVTPEFETTPADVTTYDPIGDWEPTEEQSIGTTSQQLADSVDVSQLDRTAERNTQPVVAELSSEILAIESAEINDSVQQLSQPVSEAPRPSQTNTQIPSTPPPMGGDIALQYKTSETEAPEPSAIFDAASQSPQPLKHPEKKKFGLTIIIAVLVLIVIGVGGGVLFWALLVK